MLTKVPGANVKIVNSKLLLMIYFPTVILFSLFIFIRFKK